MRLHTFVILLRFCVLAALGVLAIFVFWVDPGTLTFAGYGLFFLSLWALVAGLSTLGLISLARRVLRAEAAEAYRAGALRQGALIGGYVTGLALAQFFGYFAWWVALLTLVLILLIEFTVRQLVSS